MTVSGTLDVCGKRWPRLGRCSGGSPGCAAFCSLSVAIALNPRPMAGSLHRYARRGNPKATAWIAPQKCRSYANFIFGAAPNRDGLAVKFAEALDAPSRTAIVWGFNREQEHDDR